jgi:hypothetical protein
MQDRSRSFLPLLDVDQAHIHAINRDPPVKSVNDLAASTKSWIRAGCERYYVVLNSAAE